MKKKKPVLPPSYDIFDALNQVHRDSICTETREIWLHSTHAGDDEPGVEYRMATMFLKNLNLLEKDGSRRPILVHMHVTGGEWNDGMAIYDAIKLSPCPITIIAYAQASSMSGIILQAAKTRLMMPNCEFMAHTGSLDTNNETLVAFKLAQRNMECHKLMLSIFAERCMKVEKYKGLALEEVMAKIDWWMKNDGEINILAAEAVENGFADAVIGSKEYPTVYDAWGRIMSG
jgi:ATP-dependent protease ClpP protease subunit